MFQLSILMLERVGIIILMGYILISFPMFKNLITHRKSFSMQLALILIFSTFVILSNVNGIEISDDQIIVGNDFSSLQNGSSLANTRALTIGISGLIGGQTVGIIIGIVSSVTRFAQGGLDPQIYIISSLLIGAISGFVGEKHIRNHTLPKPLEGAAVGLLLEVVQMLCILILSSDFNQASSLVQFIIFPMLVMNSVGMAIFMSFINAVRNKELRDRAIQTHDVLQLANATLPYFRSGLNIESCTNASKEIKKYIPVSAVSITNRTKILAHVGVASDHHKPDTKLKTDLSKGVIRSGSSYIAYNHYEIGCNHPGCELAAAIVVPLITKKGIVGTLKFYFTDTNQSTFVERQLAEGLGRIFSSQIELGESDLQSKLLQDAEIKSLQAQVNPHFFFNAINTISALVRIDSDKARKLLLKLSDYFRANLVGQRSNLITLENEMKHVQAYKILDQTRFPNRYNVNLDIENHSNNYLVPPFILQILVENAFKHAFEEDNANNQIWIKVFSDENHVYISVRDNGAGIPNNLIDKLGKEPIYSKEGSGSALENLNRRLLSLYDNNSGLDIESSEKGTNVSCILPKLFHKEEK